MNKELIIHTFEKLIEVNEKGLKHAKSEISKAYSRGRLEAYKIALEIIKEN